MATNMFITFLNMSISGTLAAAMLLLWRAVSYRYVPAKFYYALWMVLMFRFAVPFNFKSVFSVLNLFENADSHSFGNSYVVTMEYLDYTDLAGMASRTNAQVIGGIAALWLIVSAFLIGLWLFFSLTVQKRLEYAVLHKSDMVRQVKSDMGIKRDIDVFVSPNVLSPVVIGFFRPRIVLPKVETLSDGDKKYAVAHEMVHIKRYDHILKAMFYFVTALHWYNPLVWWCFWLFNEDIETSCDQQVLRIYGVEHKSRYASVLVNYANRKNLFQFGYMSFAKNKVSARIEKVMEYRHLSQTKALIFTAITVFIGLSAATNPVLAADYQYVPKSVYVNSTMRNEVRQFISEFAEDIETNNVSAIIEKSTADTEYFAPVYTVFENGSVELEVEKIFHTSQTTADVYFSVTENDGTVFPAGTEKVVAQLDTSRIMGGLYADKLHSYEKYNSINLINRDDEAVQIVKKMIKFGLTDGKNTPQNAQRIAAFCMDIAYDRSKDKGRTLIPQKEVEDIAEEFFLLNDFSNLHNTDYYNQTQGSYIYDKSIGSHYEYGIIAFDKAEDKAVITVEFYKDPLQTQVEKTVKYTLKKV